MTDTQTDTDPVPAVPARRLHPRHVEVLRHSANGLTNERIAGVMHLSPNTVIGYWKDIKARLGVRTAPHAVAVALVLDLIGPADVAVPAVADAARPVGGAQ